MIKQELQEMPYVTVEQVLAMRMSMMARINELEGMLSKKMGLIRCGIGSNYSGDPFENALYIEAREVLGA